MQLNFWIPVRYERPTILGAVDEYFHLKGDVAIVTDSSNKVRLEYAESPLWLTVVKVISYATLIIPTLFFIAKCALRTRNRFHIPEQNENAANIFRSNIPSPYKPTPTNRHRAPHTDRQDSLTPRLLPNNHSNPLSGGTTTTITETPLGPEDPPLILPCHFQNQEELLREAQDFYNNFPIPKALSFDTIDPGKLSFQVLIKTLLNQYDGLCIGENHSSSSPKYFLYSNMSLFKELGVDVLYVEGYRGLQQELDKYLSGTTLELPDPIKKRLSIFSSTGPGGYTEADVCIACKEAGVRIVNIDSDSAMQAKVQNSSGVAGVKRTVAMNYQAKLIIDRDRMLYKPRKCLIYAGTYHASPIATVPGLGQIYQFPTIAMNDSQERYWGANKTTMPSYTIEKNVVEMNGKRRSYLDFHVRMDKPLK